MHKHNNRCNSVLLFLMKICFFSIETSPHWRGPHIASHSYVKRLLSSQEKETLNGTNNNFMKGDVFHIVVPEWNLNYTAVKWSWFIWFGETLRSSQILSHVINWLNPSNFPQTHSKTLPWGRSGHLCCLMMDYLSPFCKVDCCGRLFYFIFFKRSHEGVMSIPARQD